MRYVTHERLLEVIEEFKASQMARFENSRYSASKEAEYQEMVHRFDQMIEAVSLGDSLEYSSDAVFKAAAEIAFEGAALLSMSFEAGEQRYEYSFLLYSEEVKSYEAAVNASCDSLDLLMAGQGDGYRD